MSYRDPNEALRAENDSLQQQLRETQEELDGLRARAGEGAPDAVDRQRWAFGMRCLGGVALMLPFLLMTAVCEHRFMPRRQGVVVHSASMYEPAPLMIGQLNVPRPNISHACQNRSTPSPGFEGFTRSIERSARVTQVENLPGVTVGTPCTVRVVPVSMQDFNCHVEVICNGQTVYGALPTGYTHCDVDRATVLRAIDSESTAQDGDPAVNIDLTAYRAVVTDSLPAGHRRVALALDTPPSLD